ncbi:hypothetical protein [Cystobacter ferrugineus]|uniref:Uncharacterized protein n=1 Tax=Cystobacter ferrugineus TaxID=83449 RepID=A0A1L9BGG1_9BACT|nr:hypothetical protein [Cystobacter ferrugineus]OJH41362.1 hypothetical protein BON30_10890 [Cystobacter ferrugineus]
MSDQNKAQGSITTSMSEREQVERTADRLRDELLLTLEELDRRRERALDIKYQARQLLERNRQTLLAVGGVALAVIAVGAGFSWWNERRQARIVWERRGRALRRAWAHPDQVASSAKEQPLALELGRKLVFIFGSALASALAKNAVSTLVPSSETPSTKQGNKRMGLSLMQQEARA